MEDRELLEMAAKAADIKIVEWNDGSECYSSGEGFILHGNAIWNPLEDDGDALRLSVKTGEPFVVRTRCVTTMGGLQEDFDPSKQGDDLRATRRAIVRAAAEIGKNMK